MTGSEPTEERPTVLVVEDEEETAQLYEDVLGGDYEVLVATDGEGALALLSPSVDVVLLDRRMPRMSGDEVLEEIRAREGDYRVVMVTAVDPDVDAIGLDFDDYLVKPVSPADLVDAVERMLIRKTVDAQLREAMALTTKMSTLESKLEPVELEHSERYRELEARFKELRGSIGDVDPNVDPYAQLSKTKLEALYDFD